MIFCCRDELSHSTTSAIGGGDLVPYTPAGIDTRHNLHFQQNNDNNNQQQRHLVYGDDNSALGRLGGINLGPRVSSNPVTLLMLILVLLLTSLLS